MANLIYKIASGALWREAQRIGEFRGAPIDIADGYIHFSTAEQAVETAAKHFRGRSDLVIAAIATTTLGSALKWEPSRGGALFPHLYAPLPMSAVRWVRPLTLDADGSFPVSLLD